MEALILLVVLVVLFLLLRFYRTGKMKYRAQQRQCSDQRALMIVLRDDIQDELGHHHPYAAFEKALVLLGLYDQIINSLQDDNFIHHLKNPQNLEGGKLLQSLSSGDLAQYLEQHTEVLRQTYFEGLLTMMRLNQQLNLRCEMQSWNRPNAEGQKHLPDPNALHPALKNLLEQRLSLCQQIIELTLGLLQSDLNKISVAASRALTSNESAGSNGAVADSDAGSGAGARAGTGVGAETGANDKKSALEGSSVDVDSAGVDDGIEVTLSLLPTVPVCPDILGMTEGEMQQLYTKYQKILQLVLSTERLTCLALRALTILPTSNTKLKDLGLSDKD